MTVDTETEEAEQEREVNIDGDDEHHEEQHRQEREKKQEERVKSPTIHPDSPPSTFSLSSQSNRSYMTPSPATDFAAYADPLHDGTPSNDSFSWPDKSPSSLAQPNRSFPPEPLVVTKAPDPEAEDGVVDPVEAQESGGGGGGLGSFNRRKLRPELSNRKKRRTTKHGVVKRLLLAFRVFGFAFCLISFSVMAANRDQGWALDSFYRYKEFRYCLGVNVAGFAYSGFQMLSYLLMSASSSAATRVEDWQSNWGKDKFPDMAHASVGLSFAAFVALAWSSIISGYMLCTWKAS
ncbi:hypothetical protein TIFTF001_011704 [Ficus carica]|uniref:CASP-like protein n=1 Tax=Ficus carica TaxID=3494 RepID=A0AA87ZUL9_FICCA|nr:hypothetical protein TIFTF001_011704 [Ficus carica]